jgi:hypothetical protein
MTSRECRNGTTHRPDSIDSLKSTLLNLAAGQAVRISDADFKTLTGDKITDFW